MRCQYCGHKNDKNATSCEKCGTKLRAKQFMFQRIPGNIGCRCGTSYALINRYRERTNNS